MGEIVTSYHRRLTRMKAPRWLRKKKVWICWRAEQRPGEAKPRKMPYYADGARRYGKQGRPEERARLVTFEQAKRAAVRGGHTGVGFVLLNGCGFAVVDFDYCIDSGTGQVNDEVARAIMGTYAEYSPSGKGIHCIVRGDLGNGKCTHGSKGFDDFGIELFSSSGFVTFTGDVRQEVEEFGDPDAIEEPNSYLLDLIRKRIGTTARHETGEFDQLTEAQRDGLNDEEIEELLGVLDPNLPHKPWLDVGMALHHETYGDGFHLWDAWSAPGRVYPGSEVLAKRWESFSNNGSTGHPITIQTVKRMAKAEGVDIAHFNNRVRERLLAEQIGDVPDVDLEDPQETADPALDFDDDDDATSATKSATNATKSPETPVLPYFLERAHEIAGIPKTQWLIKGVLPQADLVLGIGPPGSGKSFAFMDMGLALAAGRAEWRGHRIKQKRRVVYIAAEGAGGIPARLQAYADHTETDLAHVDFHVIRAAPNVLDPDTIGDIIRTIRKQLGRADLIICDTFAQMTPGANENSGEDMGRALGHLNLIRRKTGATVLLVHHAGKDETKGARGWSGLNGAADATLTISRDKIEPNLRCMTIAKQKDGVDGARFFFQLDTIQVGIDEDGDAVTSCVCEPCDPPATGTGTGTGDQDDHHSGRPKRSGAMARLIDDVLSKALVCPDSGPGYESVLADAMAAMDPPGKGERDTRRQRARRALNQCLADDFSPYFKGADGFIYVRETNDE